MKNISSSGQLALTKIFKSIADLLPETDPYIWDAIVEVGKQERQYNTLIYRRDLL